MVRTESVEVDWVLSVQHHCLGLRLCPGFHQDRVNFHQKPGGDIAGPADPNWPNRTGYSIPCAVMLGSGEGGAAWWELTRGLGAHGSSGR